MKIPDKIQIIGTVYDVITDNEGLRKDSNDGDIRLREQKISIRKEPFMSKRYIESSFLHELTHAVFFEIGEHELARNEKLVGLFASCLQQALDQLEEK